MTTHVGSAAAEDAGLAELGHDGVGAVELLLVHALERVDELLVGPLLAGVFRQLLGAARVSEPGERLLHLRDVVTHGSRVAIGPVRQPWTLPDRGSPVPGRRVRPRRHADLAR